MHIEPPETARPVAERPFEDPDASLFHAVGEHAEEGTKRFLDLPFRDGIRLRTRLC